MAGEPLHDDLPPRPVPVVRPPDDEARPPPRARLSTIGPGAPRTHSVLYSQIVGLLKFVLPAAAMGIAALVLLWPQLNPLDQRFRLAPVQVSIEDLENLRMVQPRYVGVDERNQPFAIVAEQATQAKGSSEATELASPQGDIALGSGVWLALTAEGGLYHQADKSLELWGAVTLFHDGGYEIATDRARVDLDRSAAEGDAAVRGQGPNSMLAGEGFRIRERGARVELTGRSRVLLYPEPRAAPTRPQTAQQPAPPAVPRR